MIYRYSYDKEGFLIAQEHFGGDFVNPIDDFEGVSKYKFSYDSNGNMISKKNYSKDGALVADCNFVLNIYMNMINKIDLFLKKILVAWDNCRTIFMELVFINMNTINLGKYQSSQIMVQI